MIRTLYTALLAVAAPVFWLGLRRRAKREGGQWDILGGARFGRYGGLSAPIPGRLWVHAVSLGETRAAKPLIDGLLAAGTPLLITHATATAREECARLFAPAIAQGRLELAWLPYDFPRAMAGFLAHFRPCAGVLIEREIWPNLVAAARKAEVPLVLVSARLSARSARGMARLRPLMRPAFAGLDQVLAQTQADARRITALGARRVSVMGNLKFDVTPADALQERGRRWRAAWGRPVIMFASTREGEEARFLAAVEATPDLPGNPLFLLVPRHPERFDDVAALLADAGLAFARRSRMAEPASVAPDTRWMLGDSVGEMAAYYATADVAIIGGSFADFGGQNLVEASAAGLPVIVGPSTRNFAQAVEDALEAGAARQVDDAAAAVRLALDWLADPAARQQLREAAAAFVAAHRGATAVALTALQAYVQPAPVRPADPEA